MSGSMVELDAFRMFEASGWEQKADPYDRFFGPITDQVAEPLLDAASVGPGIRVLDLATGPGYVAGRAAKRGANVFDIDIAAAMVALASDRLPTVTFQVADAEELPFERGAFDAVVGNFILPDVGDADRVVADCARVLVVDGTLALSMWESPERNRLFGVLTDAVAECSAEAPAGLPTGPPFFRYSADDALLSLLNRAGFEDVEIERIEFTRRFANSDELWGGLIGGTVRISALVTSQPAAMRRRLREAFDRLVAARVVEDCLEIPVSIKIVAGRKRLD